MILFPTFSSDVYNTFMNLQNIFHHSSKSLATSHESSTEKAPRSFSHFVQELLPYLFMAIASFLPFLIYFKQGIPTGDDQPWHLSYITALVEAFKSGKNPQGPLPLLMGDYGYDVYLFYGPFPHYLTAILTYLFEWNGATVIRMIKFVTILSVFVSSVFTYLLARKITKSQQIATLFGVAFIFFPYRIYCFLYRAAFSEAVAISLIPVVFYGVYRILHDEKPHVGAYLTVVIGMSCLILSRPFTALLTAIAVVIDIIFNTTLLIKIMKSKWTWIYLVSSIALILGFISFYFFPLLSAQKTNIFRITADPVTMWTTSDHMAWSTSMSAQFAGFLDFSWLADWRAKGWTLTNDTVLNWSLSLVFFILSCIGTILVDYFLKKNAKLTAWRPLFCFITTFLLSAIYWSRVEIYLALAVFYLFYLYFEYDRATTGEELPERFEPKALTSSADLYAGVVILIASLFLLFDSNIWSSMPKLFYNAQFAFRVWSIFGFIAYFVAMGLAKFAKGHRSAVQSLAFVTALLFVLDQAPVDKRIAAANGGYSYSYFNADSISSYQQMGWQDEFAPNVFFDSTYTSAYSNSLYYDVRTHVSTHSSLPRSDSAYKTPVFLEGAGTVKVEAISTPNLDLTVTVTSSDALLQIPQFYYQGYQVTLTSGTVTTKEGVSDVDGLVAFKLSQGDYKVHVSYPGTTTYKVGHALFYVSIFGALALGVGGYYIRKKDEAKAQLTPEKPAVAN
jgi:hypothetical protein